jgi:hypothetical protein
VTATTPTAAPGPSPKLNEVEQTIAMVQAWHDGAEYASDDPELDRIDFSKIISVLGDFRTALLASAAGGENDPDRSLWALEKAREIANQICSDSSPPTFRAKLIDLVMGALYTVPPPPVGELQGVSDREVKAAAELFSKYSDESFAFSLFRKMLESFAASRPVADKDARRMDFVERNCLLCLDTSTKLPGGNGEFRIAATRANIDVCVASTTKAGGAS